MVQPNTLYGLKYITIRIESNQNTSNTLPLEKVTAVREEERF